MGFVKEYIRACLDELLRESFAKKNTLLKEFRGEILELEYKNDEDMIQDLLDNYELRIKDLETKLAEKELEIAQLQADKDSLQSQIASFTAVPDSLDMRLSNLEEEKNLLENRILALENPEL